MKLGQSPALLVLPLLLGACTLGFARESVAWIDPLLCGVNAEYRHALAKQTQLQTELATLPATTQNQQSGRLGFQTFAVSRDRIPYSAWVEVELPEETAMDAVVLVPVDAPYREFPGPGYGFPVRFRVEVRGGAADHVVANHTDAAFANPGGLPVWIPTAGIRGRRVRITMIEPWTNDHRFFLFALGEIMVMRGNRNLAVGAPVTTSEQFESLSIWGKANLTDGQSLLGAPLLAERSVSLGYHSLIVNSSDEAKWVQVDLGVPTPIDEVRMIGAYVVQFPGRPGFGFPVRFKIEASDQADFSQPVMLVDQTGGDFPNPASNPVTFRLPQVTARYVRVTATKLWERAENFAFVLAELQIYSGDRNVAQGKAVQCLDQYPTARSWLPQHLTDGFASEHQLTEWPEWLRGLSRRRDVLGELAVTSEQVAHAREVAVNRLGYLAWVGGLGALGGLLAIGQRVRRSRERAVEQLRQRIASDLHDEIGSNLGSIALLSEMGLRREGGIVAGDLEEIRLVARQTADSMRDIVELIQRPAVTGEEFGAKLRAIATRMLVGRQWTFAINAPLDHLSLSAQRQLLLAFKETLHNACKHAAAKNITMEISSDERGLHLKIADDGVGFDATQVSEGHGLANLRQRAATLGGALTIQSQPGRGTTLVLSVNPRTLRSLNL